MKPPLFVVSAVFLFLLYLLADKLRLSYFTLKKLTGSAGLFP